MAMAGYDPRKAPAFWQRMSQQGGKVAEFLSTHPSDEHRMNDLEKEMPEALKYYKGQGVVNDKLHTSKEWTF